MIIETKNKDIEDVVEVIEKRILNSKEPLVITILTKEQFEDIAKQFDKIEECVKNIRLVWKKVEK